MGGGPTATVVVVGPVPVGWQTPSSTTPVEQTVVVGATVVDEGRVDEGRVDEDEVVVVDEDGTDVDVVEDVVLVVVVVVVGAVQSCGRDTVADRVAVAPFDQRAVTVSVTETTSNPCVVVRVNDDPDPAGCDPAGEYPAGDTIDHVRPGRLASGRTVQSTDQPSSEQSTEPTTSG